MATAQLLTLTHGVDDKVTRIDDEVKGVGGKVIRIDDEVRGIGGKVNNIGDTVRVVQEGAQYIMFSCVSVYANRWKRDESNRATDSKRSDCNHAPYGRQRQRSEEFVNFNNPNPRSHIDA